MSEVWEEGVLGEVVDVKDGTHDSPKYVKEGVPFVTQKNIRLDGLTLENTKHISWDDHEKIHLRSNVVFGDILISMIGANRGMACIVDSNAVFSIKNVGLIKKSDIFDQKFLLYYLKSNGAKQYVADASRGGAQAFIGLKKLRSFPVPLPPLSEQKRIVSILDEAFGAIERAKENAQKNLANARELFESYLNRVFTEKGEEWEERSLADLGVADRVITYGVIKLGDAVPDGVPCLRTSNVKKLHIDLDGMKRIARSLSEDYARTILQGGEVLVNVRGTLGGVVVVPPEMIGWNVSREVAVVPVNIESIDPSFVALWIAAKNQQDWLTGVKKGAAYTGINIEDLRRLPVCFPNEREQQSLVRLIEAAKTNCSNLASDYQQKLAALDELKQSILQKAFTGRLTAKSPELEAVG